MPTGTVLYTEERCEAIGGRLDRRVKDTISVVPAPPPAASPKDAKKDREKARPAAASAAKVFQKAPNAPVLLLCYDPKDGRSDVPDAEVSSAIAAAAAAWSAGCNVTFEFSGSCPVEIGRHDRPIDYRVEWAAWDDTLRLVGDNAKTYREHAIAAASPRMGVSLNRLIDGRVFARTYRFAIVHELGHVLGLGHSASRADIMYSDTASTAIVPSESDLAACNASIEARFGVTGARR
jgi:hypothetical protein